MEDIVMDIAVQVLAPLAVSVASGLAIWILGEAARWVRAKTKNERITSAIDRLCHTAASTVAELEQVMVPAMKARAADGKLSAADRYALKTMAMKRIRERLAPEVQKHAGAAINDLDGFLRAKIEQAVLDMKLSRAVK